MSRRWIGPALVGTAGLAVGGVLLATSATAATSVPVQGTVAGSYTSIATNPDTGHAYKVTAHGHTSLGSTQAAGRVSGPGNVASGRCAGRLKLTTGKGTLVVSLRSQKTVKSFASCQSGFAFNWHVVSGTGNYKGKSGSGEGTLTLFKPGNSSESPPPAYVTFDPEH